MDVPWVRPLTGGYTAGQPVRSRTAEKGKTRTPQVDNNPHSRDPVYLNPPSSFGWSATSEETLA